MQLSRSLRKIIPCLLLLFSAGALNAQEGLSDAFARLQSCWFPANTLFGPSVVTADFNHDRHADGALLIRDRDRFRIELHFRSRRITALTFASSRAALSMLALDVNQDGSPDLVVQDPFSHQRLFVWINDGRGTFHPVPVDSFNYETGTHHRISPPSQPKPDSDWLLTPGKMRLRSTEAFAHLQIAACLLNKCLESAGQLAWSAKYAPNLVRGSPAQDC